LKLGDPLLAIGYPKVQELTLTEGMYTGLTSLKDGLDMDSLFYKTTIPITGGNSGGALIAMKGSPDWGYCLAGLATASYRDVSFMSYFSTNENLQKVVKNLLNKEGKTTTKSETPAPAPSGNRIDSK
jgi:S1-C subfamily serine protease